MIQHDMMMFDHGMPGPDGKVSPEQRREADVNIEFQMDSKLAAESQKLAWAVKAANEKYATDYPAAVGPHMTNTDSTPFMDIVPSISLRENERGAQIGGGWDPHWHQPTDVFATFSDADFRLGLNAAQTTLGALGQLAGADDQEVDLPLGATYAALKLEAPGQMSEAPDLKNGSNGVNEENEGPSDARRPMLALGRREPEPAGAGRSPTLARALRAQHRPETAFDPWISFPFPPLAPLLRF